jgi:repressor LexA
MMRLTDRQREVLRCISRHVEKGLPPSLREIGRALSIASTNGVQDHLKALERKGYITRDDLKSRAIYLTDAGRAAISEAA